MSPQSSPAVMLRALVMLVCVVAIPLAAVFGKSIPGAFRALLDGRWFAAKEASRAPAWPVLSPPGEMLRPSDPKVIPAAYESPLPQPPGNMPIVQLESAEPAPHRLPNPQTGPVVQDTLISPPSDRFTYIQDRLRQLGATEYRLEFWGDSQQLYRFSCRMAVGVHPGHTRYFEATDPDHLRAMAQILNQVEAWRADEARDASGQTILGVDSRR